MLVQLKPQNHLAAVYAASASLLETPAAAVFERYKADILHTTPMPIFNRGASTARFAAGLTAAAESASDGYVVAANVAESQLEALKQDSEVAGVFEDVPIGPAPVCAGDPPVGAWADVFVRSGAKVLSERDASAAGVKIVIVDSGINGATHGPSGSPIMSNIDATAIIAPPGIVYVPGSAPVGHGTMCAFDALIGAPKATLIDVALLQDSAGTLGAFLSDAIPIFTNILQMHQAGNAPTVVSNSWVVYTLSTDAPQGSPLNYSHNPHHPFNQIVDSLVAAGIDVLFAAGNCGDPCPLDDCGDDHGPGKGIHGANSHPSVISVGAVTVNDERLGYSSQGPGDIDPQKPDIMGSRENSDYIAR